MNSIGTYAWGEQRGGRLTAADRLFVIRAAITSRLKRALRGDPRLDRDAGRLDLEALRLPDSALVKRVTEVCVGAYSGWLMNHGVVPKRVEKEVAVNPALIV
jgi:hypothetical protein